MNYLPSQDPSPHPSTAKRLAGRIAGITVALTALLSGPSLAQNPVEVSLSVASYPTVSLTPPYMAGLKLGVFEREGIKVTRISGSGGGGQTVRNVLSGQMSFGEVSPSAAAAAFLKGEKIVVLAGGVRAISDIYYVVKKGSPIKTIADLRGKSIGYTSPGSTSQAVIELILKKVGMTTNDVKLRAMGGVNENVTALLAGGVDAAVMLEPIFTQNPAPFQVVIRAQDYYPGYQQTVIIGRESFVKENPETVRRFLKAYQAAVNYVYQNPDATADAWAAETGVDQKVTRQVVGIYAKAKQWSSQLEASALMPVQDAMRLSGIIKPGEKFPWQQFIVQDYLPANIPRLDLAELNK